MDPDKYTIIFDNSSEYLEALGEVANSFLKILLNQMVDKTMVAAVKAEVK